MKEHAQNLERKFGFVFIDTEKLISIEEEKYFYYFTFRASSYGKRIMKIKSRGHIIPTELLAQVIIKKMEHCVKQGNIKFLIHDFPTNMNWYNLWKDEIDKYFDIRGAVCLEADKNFIMPKIIECDKEQRNIQLTTYENYLNKGSYIYDYFEEKGQAIKYIHIYIKN